MKRFAILLLVATPAVATAQPDRFELGRRLIQFEKAWDQTKDADAKKRSVTHLNQAVRSFFLFSFGSAGESLDRARHALTAAEMPTADTRWAESLYMLPESRLVDSGSEKLTVVVKPFYKVGKELPKNAKVRFTIDGKKGIEAPIAELPLTVQVPFTEKKAGDGTLRLEVIVENKTLASATLTISRAENLSKRLGALGKMAARSEKVTTIEQATLRHLVATLTDLADKKTLETNFPAARILADAEAISIATRKDVAYDGFAQPGQHWLRVPTGNASEPIRLLVPDTLNPKKPAPLVFALHGAGGSENMFFDGYGDGITAKLCQERGWIMVATRANGPFGIGTAPNVPMILDELQKRLPIDAKRVYLVGHSMGAGHVLSIAQKSPDRFAGAAVLGGGSAVRQVDAFKKVPLYIACGKDDFALSGARNLAKSLQKTEGAQVTFREYDHIEHLLIVREAMPDVFRMWDGK